MRAVNNRPYNPELCMDLVGDASLMRFVQFSDIDFHLHVGCWSELAR